MINFQEKVVQDLSKLSKNEKIQVLVRTISNKKLEIRKLEISVLSTIRSYLRDACNSK